MDIRYRTSLLLLMLASPLFSMDITARETLVFGVHPYKKPSKIYEMFKPLTRDLGNRMGKEIKLVIGKSYADIIEQHQQGQIDFGYFGPASYVKTRKKIHIIPLARIKMKGRGAFRGVIMVRADSKIKTLAQLKSKSFAFGDPESTLSHYVPHYMLIQAGVTLSDLNNYAFTGNHDNVALNVLHGNFTAGGLKPAVAKQYLNKGLRILAKSQWIPEHLFAANEKLKATDRNKLKQALLQTKTEILKHIKPSITGIEPAMDEDYNGLRKIINETNHKDPIIKAEH